MITQRLIWMGLFSEIFSVHSTYSAFVREQNTEYLPEINGDFKIVSKLTSVRPEQPAKFLLFQRLFQRLFSTVQCMDSNKTTTQTYAQRCTSLQWAVCCTHGATCLWLSCTIPPLSAFLSSPSLNFLHTYCLYTSPLSLRAPFSLTCTRVKGNHHHQN